MGQHHIEGQEGAKEGIAQSSISCFSQLPPEVMFKHTVNMPTLLVKRKHKQEAGFRREIAKRDHPESDAWTSSFRADKFGNMIPRTTNASIRFLANIVVHPHITGANLLSASCFSQLPRKNLGKENEAHRDTTCDTVPEHREI